MPAQNPLAFILQLANVALPCMLAVAGIVFVLAAPARWGRGGTPLLLACVAKLLLHVVQWATYAFVVPGMTRGGGTDIPVLIGIVNFVFSFGHTAIIAAMIWAVYAAANGAANGAGQSLPPMSSGVGPLPVADPRYAYKPPTN